MIWLLLFFCGKGFGAVLSDGSVLGKTLGTALIFASLTSLLPWGLIVLCMRQPRTRQPYPVSRARSGTQFLHALRDCLGLEHGWHGGHCFRFQLGWLDAITTSNCFTC
jgi:hypothetical protein